MRRAFQIIREGETVKKYLLLLLPLCLLLSGCGHSKREAVQDYYASIRTAQAEAQIVVHLDTDDRTFTVSAAYDRQRGTTTTILEPETLRGLSATVTAEELQLLYDGSVWAAGDGGNLSAANAVQLTLYAAGQGFVTREGTDKIGTLEYLLLTCEATDGAGETYACTLWVQPESFAPYAAELSREGKVLLTVTFTQFTCQTEEDTEEST